MKSLDKKKTTNEQKWKVVKETISNQDGIIKSISFTKIPKEKPKELEWIKDWKQLNPNWTEVQISFIGSLLQDLEEEIRVQQRTEILEQILNLECLKEEKHGHDCNKNVPELKNLPCDCDNGIRNNFRKEIKEEIKEEITKDLFKDFKQVSNPLDEDYE